ncbi:uncharacterized protein [Chelonus insularis]|uniref:uncharacterized protein n=1 Tax=Chelonus insularis TaxID=460826 RepID=UPI00158A7E9B|nr:uncharacterized protein LOC118069944 [Chelonus insularis]
MDNVEHLWNIIQTLKTNDNLQVNELRNYYVRCCKELSDEVDLPKQIFGLSTMCNYCGSLWSTVDSKVRISKGRGLSNSIQKLVRLSSKKSSNLTKYQQKLMQNCLKKQSNKLIITCGYCNKTNEVTLNKPKRLKNKKIEEPRITPRKKKKRKKDKNAGLIITNTPNNLNDSQNNENKNGCNSDNKHKLLKMKNGKRKKVDTSTPNNKSKKINISKLKGIINTTITPSKKVNLHSFLEQLG